MSVKGYQEGGIQCVKPFIVWEKYQAYNYYEAYNILCILPDLSF